MATIRLDLRILEFFYSAKKFIIILPLFFLFGLQRITAQEIITGKGVEAYLKNEFNRSFYYYGELSFVGGLELDSRYTLKGGISLGLAKDITDFRGFTSAAFNTPFLKQLNFSLAFIYNGLPEYDAHSYTILPLVSFNAKWAGISLGTALRFTSFFGEPAIFESVLSVSAYANFINDKALLLGISCANFNEFKAGNMGDYSFCVNCAVRLTERWSITNVLELMQSGSEGLSSNFYGIAWKSGVKYTW
jgi:hypothetical protein